MFVVLLLVSRKRKELGSSKVGLDPTINVPTNHDA